MLAAINVLRGERGHAPATLEQLRPHVSKGARAMILSAFPQLGEAAREALVQPFLDAYEREIGLHGRPFDGVEDMLAAITSAPARAVGMEGSIGSLKPGRAGDVVIWDHDPPELGSRPKAIWIAG